ncbi:ATP-binding protein [Hydrogenophaga sp.]|uniref:ATP-binding protein n=1 Tax=Hydrogenophaga sp. TaxID=1904254 RepID=UPI00262836D1|nr:ATP-binding protein [Hydrogenophaga sp.]MCW5653598.1 ATP-binding protein [Hydrogenophaga sp.]
MIPRDRAATVALLGGESSGKTTLATGLQKQLQDLHGLRAVLVPEYLRTWCQAAGRAPRAHEQAAIAEEQTRLIRAAQAAPGVDVVIADTTALMVAAYSALYFQDDNLLPPALAEQAHHDLTLLMGLDLPWTPDGLFRDSPAIREATDTWLRHTLQTAGIRFQTVYGPPQARERQALRAIGHTLDRPLVARDTTLETGLRPWSCDTCSDPDCEHRLFTALLPTRPI